MHYYTRLDKVPSLYIYIIKNKCHSRPQIVLHSIGCENNGNVISRNFIIITAVRKRARIVYVAGFLGKNICESVYVCTNESSKDF